MEAPPDYQTLVLKIRKARQLTQEQLAQELEVTYGTVNAWENGKHVPIRALASRLRALAEEAGVAVHPKSPKPRSPPSASRKRRKK